MKTTAQVTHYLQTCDIERTSCADVSRALGICERTLYRRLTREGSLLTTMVVAEKKRRCDVLMASGKPLYGDKLADICGYADRHNFYRAFKSWHGMGFLEYKRVNCGFEEVVE